MVFASLDGIAVQCEGIPSRFGCCQVYLLCGLTIW